MSNLRRVSLYIMYFADLLAIFLSFLLSYVLRTVLPRVYVMPELSYYIPLLFVSVISYTFLAFGFLYEDSFLSRRPLQELGAVVKMIFQVVVIDIFILFFTKTSEQYSRVFVGLFIILSAVIDYCFRLLIKEYIFPRYKNSQGSEKIVIITTRRRCGELLARLEKAEDWRYSIDGVILVDADGKGSEFNGYPVVGNADTVFADIEEEKVDSVLLQLPDTISQKEWLSRFQKMGKTVYLQLEEFYYNESSRTLDYLGDCAVVSYLPAMPVRGRTLVIKRALDVAGSLLLLPLLFVAAAAAYLGNLLTDRGPVFVARIRIGKNGRKFNMYRFRILPVQEDPGKKGKRRLSPMGYILYHLHLDGLPEVWNVFVGNMSFVGPQALTLKKYVEHDIREIRNLCTRPGILGFWTLKRSSRGHEYEINEYIDFWRLQLDAKILFASAVRFLLRQSQRIQTPAWYEEEREYLRDYQEFQKPVDYDRTLYKEQTSSGYVFYQGIKRLADIIGSVFGLVFLSPLFLFLMILLIANNGGNPFYGHRRVGKCGKRITVYKFKSMRQDAENLEKLLTPEQLQRYRTEFKIDDDPRVTRVGTFLRKSSLDELPQLWNILKGDMSIVGPRPVTEEETRLYGADMAKLLSARPGLTGYWQAYARNNATYESGERQKMELHYIDHQGILFDIRILFRTVFSVIRQEGVQ